MFSIQNNSTEVRNSTSANFEEILCNEEQNHINISCVSLFSTLLLSMSCKQLYPHYYNCRTLLLCYCDSEQGYAIDLTFPQSDPISVSFLRPSILCDICHIVAPTVVVSP